MLFSISNDLAHFEISSSYSIRIRILPLHQTRLASDVFGHRIGFGSLYNKPGYFCVVILFSKDFIFHRICDPSETDEESDELDDADASDDDDADR